MKQKFKFKRTAIIKSIINEMFFKVILEDGEEVVARISFRQQKEYSQLSVGQSIVVVANPYEEKRVKVHNETWGKR